jgi:hypothetical protein
MTECNHDSRQEVHLQLMIIQRCMKCGVVREYNPEKKRLLIVSDSELWSEWGESHPYVDKMFVD